MSSNTVKEKETLSEEKKEKQQDNTEEIKAENVETENTKKEDEEKDNSARLAHSLSPSPPATETETLQRVDELKEDAEVRLA